MKRPCFALTVLLCSLCGPLLLVQRAHSQAILDGRVGCVRYQLCPLLDYEIVCPLASGEFGSVMPVPNDPPAPRTEQPAWAWSCPLGYDRAYDEAMFGARIENVAEAAAVAATVAREADEAAETGELNEAGVEVSAVASASVPENEPLTEAESAEAEEGWDWCEQACQEYQPAVTAQTRLPIAFVPMDREPETLAEYYTFYGGQPDDDDASDYQLPLLVFGDTPAPPSYEQNYGYVPADVAAPLEVSASIPWRHIVTDWVREQVPVQWLEHVHCRLEGLRHQWTSSSVGLYLRDAYRRWEDSLTPVATENPPVPEESLEEAATEAPTSEEPSALSADAPHGPADSLGNYGRKALVGIARSLDRTGTLLQLASRQIMQVVDNQTVEVGVTPSKTTQR